MIPSRARLLKAGGETRGPVVYWMSRDQRVQDNWALIYARQMAAERRVPLLVVFCLAPDFLHAPRRAYGFMLRGLEELERRCADVGMPFHLVLGDPVEQLPGFIHECGAGALVADFDPLQIKRQWKAAVSRSIQIPFYEVDAHNIVPCWEASAKQEFSARTLRVKYGRILEDYLDEFPRQQRWPAKDFNHSGVINWKQVSEFVQTDRSVMDVRDLVSGETAAHAHLRRFIREKLPSYARDRNDPVRDGQSGLSPYLHFGQISAQRVAMEVRHCTAPSEAKAAFLEELIIRRELADNYCFYNDHYDSFKAFPAWAQASLNQHRRDFRSYQYSLMQFEAAQTHDGLWNAAQTELVTTGKMHGYLRMYWAKKILEWSENPEEALKTAILLNDKYQLDGRDPNGYAGCAWSIGGLHDRPWQERPVFGKIRYMNENGCRRKFNVDAYIDKVNGVVTA